MSKYILLWIFYFVTVCTASAQIKDTIEGRVITLSEVIVRNKTDVGSFINRVKADTSFYKAFRNLRILGFTALNDIRMLNRSGKEEATLQSRTQQIVNNGCRYTKKVAETVTGDFYEKNGDFAYYTAKLYSSLLFAFTPICGESNIVGDASRSLKNKSGMEKHKEQLKMLFFNPGQKIPGIPLMGDKPALFDQDMSRWYNFSIDLQEKAGRNFYVFTASGKAPEEGGDPDKLVIDQMTTWFDYETFDVFSRTYSLSYHAGVYSFSVDMEVELSRFQELLVPFVIRYNGNWKILTQNRERGVFTATLFDFVR